jgi:hypothetical protein
VVAQMGNRLARAGGALSIGVSALLAVLLATVADAGFNLANVGTLVAGALGGGLAFVRPDRRFVVGLGCFLVILGMVPALIGGVGLLYFPSVVCLSVSAAMSRDHRTAASPVLHRG